MVLTYVDEWEKYIDRVGRWVDFKNSYKTMDNSYIESVWWTLRELDKKKLLYEGSKVLMYCPHDETPLAKAEIAADNTYKDITEEAVTVKFKLKNPQKFGLPDNTYLLAWTTTPWTLPGNVALAVGPDIEYVLVEKNGEYLVMAKERLTNEGEQVTAEFLGTQLVGAEYEPLYTLAGRPIAQRQKIRRAACGFCHHDRGHGDRTHCGDVWRGRFCSGAEGKFADGADTQRQRHLQRPRTGVSLRGEYIKKAEKFIKEDLEKKGLLFARANHTHSYPHCWRCGTPLIYNAVPSWFINIQKVKGKMLSENERINWVPAHLKHGRFKNIMESAPDWTISRNRFWASPLPIWKEKGGSSLMVLGSVEELLQKTKKSGNTYLVMRHGEAQHNVDHTFDSSNRKDNTLTERGRQMVLESALKLKKESGVDMIIVSPFVRTRETAKIVQEAFGLPDSAVIVDERLREMNVGIYDGKPVVEWRAQFTNLADAFDSVPEGGETFTEIRKRAGDLFFEVERRYIGKKILFVTHESPAWMLDSVAKRWSLEECKADADDKLFLRSAEYKPLNFVPYPHNANYEMDLHRPYIDRILLSDERGRTYERIPEVIDCWVESGAMPFASNHYPFENKNTFNPRRLFGFWPKGYPADFIAEYIAQTRTWFYYMHAVGVLIFGRQSFRNVVSTGTILAADGSKMSKSKGNYTDPLNIMDQFGADALRLYLMSSVVMSGEDLSFRDEDVREAHNRVIGMLWNCYKFFELYKNEYDGITQASSSTHPLDTWILSLLGKTIAEVTESFEAYDTPAVCKTIRSFIDNYSTWYVRRSRDRVKGDDIEDKQRALAVQREVLLVLTRLMAPITPFVADAIYPQCRRRLRQRTSQRMAGAPCGR